MYGRDNNCLYCTKRNHSLLIDLINNELNILNSNRYDVSNKSGELICKEDTKPAGLICLNKGKVKIIRRGVNGNKQIVDLKKATTFICHLIVFIAGLLNVI